MWASGHEIVWRGRPARECVQRHFRCSVAPATEFTSPARKCEETPEKNRVPSGTTLPAQTPQSLRRRHPPDQILLLRSTLSPNGKCIQHAQRQRIPQSLRLPPAQIALPQNLHPNHSFPRSFHLA
jgi:hypothetical protein